MKYGTHSSKTTKKQLQAYPAFNAVVGIAVSLLFSLFSLTGGQFKENNHQKTSPNLFSSTYNTMNSASEVPVLDTLSNLEGAFSLRRLRASYTGAALLVRHGSHNAKGDLSFQANGLVGDSSLVTVTDVGSSAYTLGEEVLFIDFYNGADVYVERWYDQSGAQEDLVQTAVGSQPYIVQAGTLSEDVSGKPSLFFNSDFLVTNTLNLQAPYTINFYSKLTGGQNRRVLGGDGNRLIGYWGGLEDAFHLDAWVNYDPSNTVATTNPILYTFSRAANLATTAYKNGAQLSLSNETAGTTAFGELWLGRSALAEYSDVYISEVLIMSQVIAEPVRQEIECSQSNYFNLPVQLTFDFDFGQPVAQLGSDSAYLAYGNGYNNITSYSINWGPDAEAAGFIDVVQAPLPPDTIAIALPMGAGVGTYDGVFTVSGPCGTSNGKALQLSIVDNPSTSLDSYLPEAAYGLRRLRGAYTGAAALIRHGVHNAEGELAFQPNGEVGDSSQVTITAVGSSGYALGQEVLFVDFYSGTDVFVKQWYDQSGNNRDVGTTNTNQQPRLVIGGNPVLLSGRLAIEYDGSSDWLETSSDADWLGGQPYQINGVAQVTTSQSANYLFGLEGFSLHIGWRNTTNTWTIAHFGNDANFDIGNSYDDNDPLILTSERTSGVGSALYVNGRTLGVSNSPGNYLPFDRLFRIGRGLNNFYRGKMSEAIIQVGPNNSAAREALECDQANYFNIPYYVIETGIVEAVEVTADSAYLPYTIEFGDPSFFSLDWDSDAEAAGFTDIDAFSLPADTIAFALPASPMAGTYQATLTVGGGCGTSAAHQVQVAVVDSLPTVLDTYVPAAAFGLRRLRAGYTGPAALVRNGANNAEGDLAFHTDGEVGDSSLVTITAVGSSGYAVGQEVLFIDFYSGADVFVRRWYDQSGGQNHLVQDDVSEQPYIVQGGFLVLDVSGEPSLFFDSDFLKTNTLALSAPYTINFYSRMTGGLNGRLLCGDGNTLIGYYNGQEDVFFLNGWIKTDGPAVSTDPILYTFSRAADKATEAYKNSTELTLTDPDGGDTAFGELWLGKYTSGQYSQAYVTEVLVMDEVLPTQAREDIECEQLAYFNIPHYPLQLAGIEPAVVGADSLYLPYSILGELDPTHYTLDWDAPAEAAGFVDEIEAPLPPDTVAIALPSGVIAGTYTATLTVSGPCGSSIGYSIEAIVLEGLLPILGTTQTASAAFGLRQLSTGYAGPLVQVRRSSDNMLEDIGMTPEGHLDTAALLSFAGGGSAFVSRLYDQSGNQRHAEQLDAARQPRMVLNGVLERRNGVPSLFFDGSNDYLELSGALINTPRAGLQAVFYNNLGNHNSTVIADYDFGNNRRSFALAANANAANSEYAIGAFSFDGTANIVLVPPSAPEAFNTAGRTALFSAYLKEQQAEAFLDFALKDSTALPVPGSVLFSDLSVRTRIGCMLNNNTPANFMNGWISEAIIYPDSLAEAGRQSIECDQVGYHKVTGIELPENIALVDSATNTLSLPFSESYAAADSYSIDWSAEAELAGFADGSGMLGAASLTLAVPAGLEEGRYEGELTVSGPCGSSVAYPITAVVPYRILGTGQPASAAFSLRQLSPDYAGPVVRIRRDGDNAEQDFTAAELGDGSLLSWVLANGSNGYVSIWYDQSGYGRHKTQANNSLQPLLVSSGELVVRAGRPSILHPISGGGGLQGSYTYTANPFSVNLVMGSNNTSTSARRAIQGSNNWLIGPYQNRFMWYAGNWNIQDDEEITRFGYDVVTALQPANGSNSLFRNGASLTVGNHKGVPGTLNTGNIGLAFNERMGGMISELIEYEAVMADSVREAIECNQIAYYQTPAIKTVVGGQSVEGADTAFLAVQYVQGAPTHYSIDWDNAAEAAGWTDMNMVPYSGGDISIAQSTSIPSGAYTGTVIAEGACGTGAPYPFTMQVDPPILGVGKVPNAAFALRRLSDGYTGPAVRVRRSSDGAQQDIGFTAQGDLDTTALLSFVGSADGQVAIWYDQSLNANNAAQSNVSRMPYLVFSGNVHRERGVPAIRFDNDQLRLLADVEVNGAVQIVMNKDTLNNGGFLLGATSNFFWHTGGNVLFQSSLASSSLRNGEAYVDQELFDPELAPWRVERNAVYSIRPNDPSNLTLWNQLGADRNTLSLNGSYSEVISYRDPLTLAEQRGIECSQLGYYNIQAYIAEAPTVNGLSIGALGALPAPEGGHVGVWSKVSGPGTVTFADSTLHNTTAAADLAGDYTLRWTVSNGLCTSFAETSLSLNKLAQSITFVPVPPKTFGDPPFVVEAAASSGLPVELSVVSGPGTFNEDTLSLTGAGTVQVRTFQAGNAEYDPAEAFLDIEVAPLPGGIALSGLVQTYDGAPKAVTATTNPVGLNLEILYDGQLDEPVNAGTYTVEATFTDPNYSGGVTEILTILQSPQVISFVPVPDQPHDAGQVILSASASSGLPVGYSISTVPASGVATLAGDTVQILGQPGTVTVTAAQPGNMNYLAAQDSVITFEVLPQPPVSLALEAVTSPVNPCGLPADPPLSVQLRNRGQNDLSGFTLQYQIDGGAPVQEVVPSTINSGDVQVYTFSTPLSLPDLETAYNIEVELLLPGDADPTDDTLSWQIIRYPADGTSVSPDVTICQGDSATLFSFGGSSTEWLLGGSVIGTGDSIKVSPSAQTTYAASITDVNGCGTFLKPVTVNVTTGSIGGAVAKSSNVCPSPNEVMLTLSGFTGSIVRWESSTDGFVSDINPIMETSNPLTVNDIGQTTQFRAIVQNGACPEVPSQAEEVLLLASNGGTISGSSTVCQGSNSTVLTLSGVIGGIVKWQSSGDGFVSDVTDIAFTGTSYTVNDLNFTRSYRAVVQVAGCDPTFSTVATITVDQQPQGGFIQGPDSVCLQESLALELNGELGNVMKWQTSVDTFQTIEEDLSVMSTLLTLPDGLNGTAQFRAVVESGVCGLDTSSWFNVTVLPLPTISAGADVTMLRGSSVSLEATGGVSYEWRKLGEANVISTNPVAFVSPQNTSSYIVAGTSPLGCVNEDTVTVTVNFSGIETSPSGAIDFGGIAINTLASESVTLSNVGTLPISIDSVKINKSGGAGTTLWYSYNDISALDTLQPGDEQVFQVQFQPIAPLYQSATLTVYTSAGTIVIALEGTGSLISPAWSVDPLGLDFGVLEVGQKDSLEVVVTNTGNVPIYIDSLYSFEDVFTATFNVDTLAVGASANILVEFAPTAPGVIESDLQLVATNPGLISWVIPVNGRGFINTTKPILSYPAEFPYDNESGVSPDLGLAGEFYTWRVVYQNPDSIAPADGWPKVGIDWDGDGEFNGPLDGYFTMSQIGDGEAWISGETYTYTQALPAGDTYRYEFRVLDENGNEAILPDVEEVTIPGAEGPVVTEAGLDLFVRAGDIVPNIAFPEVNELVDVSATLFNNSLFAANNVSVRLYIDDVFQAEGFTGFIGGGDSLTVTFENLTFPAADAYTLKVVIDEDNLLGEVKRLNNTANRLLVVGGTPVPSIKVTNMNGTVNSVPFGSLVQITGQAFYQSAVDTTVQVPVQGGAVTISLDYPNPGSYTLTTTTGPQGNFSGTFQISNCDNPSDCFLLPCDSAFQYSAEVTDFVLFGTAADSTVKPCATSFSRTGGLARFLTIDQECIEIGDPITFTGGIINALIEIETDQDGQEVGRRELVLTDVNFQVSLNGQLLADQSYDEIGFRDTVTFGGILPPNLPLGFYLIIGRVSYSIDGQQFTAILDDANFNIIPDKPDLISGGAGFPIINSTVPEFLTGFDYNGCGISPPFFVHLYDSLPGQPKQLLETYVYPTGVPGNFAIRYSNPAWPLGCRFIIAEIDRDDLVDEYREDNNRAVFEFCVIDTVPSLPNIVATSISLSNPNYRAGDQANIRATIKNVGAPVDSAFEVRLYVNGNPLGSDIVINGIEAGEEIRVISTVPYTFPDDCPVWIRVFADHEDVILEADNFLVNDNILDEEYGYDLIAGTPLGSFPLGPMPPNIPGTSVNPYQVPVGATANFRSYVYNLGNRFLEDIHVRFIYDGVPIDSTVIPFLGPYDYEQVFVNFTIESGGPQIIYVEADYPDDFCEASEQNNIGNIYINTKSVGADLEVLSTNLILDPIVPMPGDTIGVTASFVNVGTDDAEPFTVRFLANGQQLGEEIRVEDGLNVGVQEVLSSTERYASTPSDAATGVVFQVVLDVGGEVPEVNVANNIATRFVFGAPPPVATILYPNNPYCRLDGFAPVELTKSIPSVTGIFTGPPGVVVDSLTGTVDLLNSVPGTYLITYTYEGGGYIGLIATAEITIEVDESASISYPQAAYCQNEGMAFPIQTGSSGGRYYSLENGLAIDSLTGAVDPAESMPGDYTVVYELGSCSTPAQTNLVINPVPVASISYEEEYCREGLALVQLTGATGGQFSAAPAGLDLNVSTGTIDLANSSAGQYAITYTVTDGATGCTAIDTASTIIHNIPPPPAVEDIVYCLGATAAPLLAQGTNLQWYTSSTGGSPLAETPVPVTSEVGDSIFYVSQTVNGCESPRAALLVEVVDEPLGPGADIQYPSPLCAEGTVEVALTGQGGGVFTSNPEGLSLNSMSGQIDLANSMGGNYQVAYTVSNGGCANSALTNITVLDIPGPPEVDSPVVYCQDDVAAPLSAQGTNLLWYESLADATGSAVAPAPGTSAIGSAFFYVSQSPNGCESERAEIEVVVQTLPLTSIDYPGSPYCAVDSAVVTLSGVADGRFSAGAGLVIDSLTGVIDLNNSLPGTYQVYYTYGGEVCPEETATATVEVIGLPTAVIRYDDSPYCPEGTASVTLASGPLGGTFSAMGDLEINPATGEVDLVASPTGTDTVLYDFTDQGCPGQAQAPIEIKPAAEPPLADSLVRYCVDDMALPLVAQGMSLRWYDSEMGADTLVGAPTPTTAQPDTVFYWVAQVIDGCESPRARIEVRITAPETATIDYPDDPYCPEGTANVVLSGPQGGRFSSAFNLAINSVTGTIDLENSAAGTYVVTYFYDDEVCGRLNTSTTVTVLPEPTAQISYESDEFCAFGTAAVERIGPAGGTYSSVPGGLALNAATGTINLGNSTAGAYIVTYTFSEGGCTNTTNTVVIINPVPPPPGVSDLLLCQGSAAAPLTAEGQNLTWYSTANGGVGSPMAPVPFTADIGITTFWVSQTVDGCESTRSAIDVEIVPASGLLSASIDYADPVCQFSGTISPTVVQDPGLTGVFYAFPASGIAIDSLTGQVDTDVTAAGTYTIVYRFTDGVCVNTASTSLLVEPAPIAEIAYPSPLCPEGEALADLEGQSGGSFFVTSAGLVLNPLTGTIDLDNSVGGNYQIGYAFSNGNCPDTAYASVRIDTLPVVSIAYPGSPYCTEGTAEVEINGSEVTGFFAVSPVGLVLNPITGEIDLEGSTPGVYTVTYTFSDGNCDNSATASVTILPAPTAQISYSRNAFCQSDGVISVSQTGQPGGSYASGPGLAINPANGDVDLAASTPGSYTVVYTFSDGPCIGTTATPLTVLANPAAPVAQNITYCLDDPASSLTATGSNLLWYNSETGGSGAAQAPVPATSAVGTTPYWVSQTVNGCESERTLVEVEVLPEPTATVVYAESAYCGLGATDAPLVSGTTGGYFRAPLGLVVDSLTGVIDLSQSVAGTYEVAYLFSDGQCDGVATTSVTITPTPAAPQTSNVEYCRFDVASPLTATGSNILWYTTPSGGTGASMPPTPSTFVPGAFTYWASQTVNGCESPRAPLTVTVRALPAAIISYPSSVLCPEGTAEVTLTGQQGGVFSSSPGLSIDPASGTIDLESSQAGQYTVTYSFSDGFCPGSATTEIEVLAPLQINVQGIVSPVCSGTTNGSIDITVSGGAAPYGYLWSTGAITEDLADIAEGAYSVSVTDLNGCIAVDTFVVQALGPPALRLNDPADRCIDDADMVFQGQPAPAIGESAFFTIDPSATALQDNGNGTAELDISEAGTGTYQVGYHFTDTNGCMDSTFVSVRILPVDSCIAVPVAVNDFANLPSGVTSISIPVTSNDNFGADGPAAGTIRIITDPFQGTATVNDNGTPGNPEDDLVDYSSAGNLLFVDSLNYEICDATLDCDTATAYITSDEMTLRLQVKVLLQGALLDRGYPEILMRDDLRKDSLIPELEPYTALSEFNHIIGGGEQVADLSRIRSDFGNAAIVDWVVVELRYKEKPDSILATRSGLLQRNGAVTDVIGGAGLHFEGMPVDSYYVSVRHRNHLGVMTKYPVPLSFNMQSVDFTDLAGDYWENSPLYDGYEQVTVDGKYALWMANADRNNQVVFAGQNNDVDALFDNVNTSGENVFGLINFEEKGYLSSDVNLNGSTIYAGQDNNADMVFDVINLIPINIFGLSTFLISEQLPENK
ncbi:CARDB domain-containing protein [Phaeodactylibacter sp.]|uniref:Ig-like domain-containing protein n=1 Tax=Phaeodactylibacter sp. TaxID=1940289 RepID=UPI0025E8B755|nr:CARDB domain-containing protein [Phaeodactylibacter sp.]MCI4647233.1 MBG domain-containing protein [Phaeodactylibacter sp.]MCI5089303.1 MBG domain-containing protein [Phaeodactylibacter sp.]